MLSIFISLATFLPGFSLFLDNLLCYGLLLGFVCLCLFLFFCGLCCFGRAFGTLHRCSWLVGIKLLIGEVKVRSVAIRRIGGCTWIISAKDLLVPLTLMEVELVSPLLEDGLFAANDSVLPTSVVAQICIPVLLVVLVVVPLSILLSFLHLFLYVFFPGRSTKNEFSFLGAFHILLSTTHGSLLNLSEHLQSDLFISQIINYYYLIIYSHSLSHAHRLKSFLKF